PPVSKRGLGTYPSSGEKNTSVPPPDFGTRSCYDRGVPLNTLLTWLGVTGRPGEPEHAPLRELVEALDKLPSDRARHLARFAYLLGRVAHADRHVSPEETRAMERLLIEEGSLDADQAMLVVALAKTSNAL